MAFIKHLLFLGFIYIFIGCGEKPSNLVNQTKSTKPIVKENGKFVSFPNDTVTIFSKHNALLHKTLKLK
jgi:hypothetical protein